MVSSNQPSNLQIPILFEKARIATDLVIRAKSMDQERCDRRRNDLLEKVEQSSRISIGQESLEVEQFLNTLNGGTRITSGSVPRDEHSQLAQRPEDNQLKRETSSVQHTSNDKSVHVEDSSGSMLYGKRKQNSVWNRVKRLFSW